MSSSISKITSPFLTKTSSVVGGFYPKDTSSLNNLIEYYNSLDTTKAEEILENLKDESLTLSDGLNGYISAVDASDAARNETQMALYQSYLDLLLPQHERQKDELNTKLLNQGLTIGSEGYSRAMNDLTKSQNQALNQAAYQSVLAGNEAFDNSFDQAIQNASLNNTSRQMQLNEIYKLLTKSMTEQEKQDHLYKLQNQMNTIDRENKISELQSILALAGSFI